jgi:hypothetical protein
MKSEQDRNAKIDELLRSALTDDLPREVEAGMRARIARVRAAQDRDTAPAAAWAWLRRRTVWAALAILMLVAGILLQGAGASSPLADRISELKTAVLNLERLRR